MQTLPRGIAKQLKITSSKIKTILQQIKYDANIDCGLFKNKHGHIREYYSYELIKKISSIFNSTEKAGEQWLTLHETKEKIGIAYRTAQKIAKPYRQSHPHWFKKMRTKTNHQREHLHPNLIKIIETKYNLVKPAPPGWLTINDIAKQAGCVTSTITRIATQHTQTHPNWQNTYRDKNGNQATHYHPDLVKIVLQTRDSLQIAPPGWMNFAKIKSKFGIPHSFVSKILDQSPIKPEWSAKYLDEINRPSLHFHPDLVNIIKTAYEKIDFAPSDWSTSRKIYLQYGISLRKFKKLAKSFSAQLPASTAYYKDQQGKTRLHYHDSLVQAVIQKHQSITPAPTGWKTRYDLFKELNCAAVTIEKIGEELDPHQNQQAIYKDGAHRPTQHYSPQLSAQIIDNYNRNTAPDGWLTTHEIAVQLGTNGSNLNKFIKKLATNPDWIKPYRDRSGKTNPHHHPELIKIITEEYQKYPPVPDNWINTWQIAKKLHADYKRIKTIAQSYLASQPQHMKICRSQHNIVCEHYHPQLIEHITQKEKDIQISINMPAGLVRELSLECMMQILGKNPHTMPSQVWFPQNNSRPDWIRPADSKFNFMIIDAKSNLNQDQIRQTLDKYPLIIKEQGLQKGYLFIIGFNGQKPSLNKLQAKQREIKATHNIDIKIRFYKLNNLLKRIYQNPNQPSVFTKILGSQNSTITPKQINNLKTIQKFLNQLNKYLLNHDSTVHKTSQASQTIHQIHQQLKNLVKDKNSNEQMDSVFTEIIRKISP